MVITARENNLRYVAWFGFRGEIMEEKEKTKKIRIEHHTVSGLVWFWAWLFTIGFLHLGFWKGVLAILL
jgi:hypothetical protein